MVRCGYKILQRFKMSQAGAYIYIYIHIYIYIYIKTPEPDLTACIEPTTSNFADIYIVSIERSCMKPASKLSPPAVSREST